MTDRAMSEGAMLTSLRDIQLPAEAAGGLAADVAAAIGLAGVCALLVVGCLRALSLRKQQNVGSGSLASKLVELSGLPDAERRVALLHILKARAPDRFAAVRGALYEPGGGVDIATLEAEVHRLV